MPDSVSLLAFDYGLRNIGVAACSSVITVTELAPLRARDGIPDWDQVRALLEQRQPGQVLVGLPLNMDGSESELSGRARKFGQRLHGRFGVKVTLVDERLSSFEAKQEAGLRGHRGNYGQQPIDSIAARLILETWLRERERRD